MKYRTLKRNERKLIHKLNIDDCYKITEGCFDNTNIDNQLIYGCIDNNLIGYFVINEFSNIQLMVVDKTYPFYHTIKEFIHFIKKISINYIDIKIDIKYLDYFIDEGFMVVHMYDTYVSLRYTRDINHQFSSFEDVYTFITSQKNRVYSLENFRKYMHEFGDIQNHLSCIHIGGTNGKGSTTNYLRNVLEVENYKVATLTSPALVTRLDVIRINNMPISEVEYVEYANVFMNSWLKYQLSMFEIEVFISIVHFIKHNVDFAVFEVGLGGELDATNIVNPIISAITNVGLDHTEFLGDTYEKIATTKAGIIKRDSAFITGETKKSCLDILKNKCIELNVEYVDMHEISNLTEQLNSIAYDYNGYHIELNSPATYQSYNSALALEILLYLKEKSIIHLSDKSILEGLKYAIWQGRFETISYNPLIIIDGAHNKEGIEAFYQSAKKFNNIKIVFSALKDKDTHSMIEKLLELTDDVTVCEFEFYRAQSAKVLAENFPVKIIEDWKIAIEEAYLHNGVTFITGSLYFISQVRSYIKQKL